MGSGNYKLEGIETNTFNIALDDNGQIVSITILANFDPTNKNFRCIYKSKSDGSDNMSEVLGALEFLNPNTKVKGLFGRRLLAA